MPGSSPLCLTISIGALLGGRGWRRPNARSGRGAPRGASGPAPSRWWRTSKNQGCVSGDALYQNTQFSILLDVLVLSITRHTCSCARA